MVNVFFQATIDFNGFSMVLTMLDHHHWMFFWGPNDWFQWVFNGFWNFEDNGQRWFGCTIAQKGRTFNWRQNANSQINICRTPIYWNIAYSNRNIVNFNDLRRLLTSSTVLGDHWNVHCSMVLKRPLDIFNGIFNRFGDSCQILSVRWDNCQMRQLSDLLGDSDNCQILQCSCQN